MIAVRISAILLLLAIATPALAQGGPPAPAGLSVSLGAGIVAAPRYPGSAKLRVLPLPAFEIRYRRLSASPQGGIAFDLVRSGPVTLGPLARPDFGRRQSDVRRYLPGLARVGFAPELGGFATFDLTRNLSLRAEARHAIGGHDGTVGEVSAAYGTRLRSGVVVSAGPRVTLTDARYTRAYFGVIPAQALASGLPAYRPGGGFGAAGASAAVVVPLGPRITAVAFGGYGRLLGDAARSPVARAVNGSRDQFTLGATLSYRFTRQ